MTWLLPPPGLLQESVPDASVSLSDVVGVACTPLTPALGVSDGRPLALDLSLLPHIALAGTSGSGKSTLIRSILASLLFVNTPDQLRLVLVDVDDELDDLRGLPHLAAEPIDDPEVAIETLEELGVEIERRRALFRSLGVRNVLQYDALQRREPVPRLLCVVDEFASLMRRRQRERVEDAIAVLGIHGRKFGIHLLLATQIPHATVLTPDIKANMSGRIALRLPSGVFSRVALDVGGAEKLGGKGDALLRDVRDGHGGELLRFQSAYLSREGLGRVVAHWRAQAPASRLTAPRVASTPNGSTPAPTPARAVALRRRRRRGLLAALVALAAVAWVLDPIGAPHGPCPSHLTFAENVLSETCDGSHDVSVCTLAENGDAPAPNAKGFPVVAVPATSPRWCPGAVGFQGQAASGT
jgi:hypothetical protein